MNQLSDQDASSISNGHQIKTSTSLSMLYEFCPILPLDDPDKETVIQYIVNNMKWKMSMDRKSTAFKSFQGCMWKSAHEQGKVKGQMYEDVVENFRKWIKITSHPNNFASNANHRNCSSPSSVRLYISSSGSIVAQKLLFQHSEHGSLLTFISRHFDTTIGPTLESSSYESIAKELQLVHDDDSSFSSENIIFLSDNPLEIKAVLIARFQFGLLDRPGKSNVPYSLKISDESEGDESVKEYYLFQPESKESVVYQVPKINSFDEIDLI